MMFAHKAVDALRIGRRLMTIPGVTLEMRHNSADLITNAQKFDFGDLLLEPSGPPGLYTLPKITDVEYGFWSDGLLPLPFEVVWYEFVIGSSRSGLIVAEHEQDKWIVQRLEFNADKSILFDQVACMVSRSTSLKQGTLATTTVEPIGRRLDVTMGGNEPYLKKVRGDQEFLENNLGMNVPLAIYLTLMLSSRTTEVSPVMGASPALIKSQQRRGRTPLPEHRIVRIVPESFYQQARAEGIAARRPPRLHWRRSHLRHYEERVPSATWAPNHVHKGRSGWWVSVIARMLVGRAELGEVSHEYFINKGVE